MKSSVFGLAAASGISLLGSFVAAESAASADFTILSLNVAGLPAVLNSNGDADKEEYATEIGERLKATNYDLNHLQEDFNYHAYIYAADNHPYRTATSGGAAIGSGLNSVSNYDWLDFERDKWNSCSDASENDCLTPKGFTFMRVRLDEGVYVDAYNLHADAGTEDGDETARNANLQQVIDFVNTNSVGNAVLIFGDTNSRYTRTADKISTVTGAGFTDAWVKLIRNGVEPTVESLCATPIPADETCEVVDKVFYRSSPFINLAATEFAYDATNFLNSSGTGALSDHIPVRVKFTWSLASNLRASDQIGGPHGDWFNDINSLPSNPVATSITVRGAERVDAISLTLSSGTTFTHGGTGGTDSTLTLASGDYITSAKVCTGTYNDHTRVFYAEFTTKNGKTVKNGATTDSCTTVTAPTGKGLVGFFGRDGDEVDRIGFYWATQ